MYILRAKVNNLYWCENMGIMADRADATQYPTRADAQGRIDAFVEMDEDQQYRWTIEETDE